MFESDYEAKEKEVVEKNYVELMLQEVEAELEKAENQTNDFFRWLLDDCEKYTGVKTSDSIKAYNELLKVGKDYLHIIIMYNSSSAKWAVLRQAKQQLLKYKNF